MLCNFTESDHVDNLLEQIVFIFPLSLTMYPEMLRRQKFHSAVISFQSFMTEYYYYYHPIIIIIIIIIINVIIIIGIIIVIT